MNEKLRTKKEDVKKNGIMRRKEMRRVKDMEVKKTAEEGD